MSTSCIPTSTGARGATSSASPPTARNETNDWDGSETPRIFVRTAAYNRDVASFFSKWLDDVSDAQLPSGAFTDFAPSLGHDWTGAPAWGDAGIIVPWTIYKMYGDRGVLERNLRAMEAWMDFLSAENPDLLRAHQLGNSYGDWLAPTGELTPSELIGTAYWAYDAGLMVEVSRAVGRAEEAAKYEELAGEIRRRVHEGLREPVGPDRARDTDGVRARPAHGPHP